ncbi:hypothetical protein PS732_05230 [Pseudomonas fluorescens]|uniref:Uncharacterized protein n=1 Tax=Pseudomonas fluorescens TaxID=294 RepID=A0ABD7VN68_PSEFL|nr:hypothetical protein PS732_05230 [Pseudomonas fluorescens]
MNDQLRAAGLVEKPLHQQRVLRRQGAEGLSCAGQVFDQLFGAGEVQAKGLREPVERRLQIAGAGAEQLVERRLQTRHGGRQLIAAPRCFAKPERNAWWLSLRILDPHFAGFHPQDAIGRVAELKDVAGNAFHGKVFVDAADVEALRLKHHAVVGVVRNGPAAGHRCQSRATTATQGAADSVAVQVGAANALAAVVALGEHRQQGLIVVFVKISIGRGLAKHRQQRVFRPFPATDFGDDLLRQHVQRCFGDVQGVEFATAYAVKQGGALDQVVTGGGEQSALGRAAHLVAGATHSLQKPGDGAGRGDLADQIDFTDINAQLQRRGGYQHLQLTALEPLFGIEAKFLGEAAVVRGHCVFAQAFAEVAAQALGEAAGVDENQRGAVLAGQFGEAIVDQLPNVVGHDGGQRHRRHLNAQIPWACMADINDVAGPIMADEKLRHGFHRFLRGGQADAGQRFGAQCLQSFQAQGQVTATFTGGHGVDFVDDHGARGAEHFASRL